MLAKILKWLDIKREPVFCQNCKSFRFTSCLIGYKNTPIKPIEQYGDCNVLNKNNDCERYEEQQTHYECF